MPEAQEVKGLVTQQEVCPAVAEMQSPCVAVPVEAEVIEGLFLKILCQP